MKNIFNLVLFLIIPTLLASQAIERQVVASGGDFIITPALSISFTIGEVAISSLENSNFILLQGFQQGETSISTGIPPRVQLQFSVYPNPTTGVVRLSLPEKIKTSWKLRIFNTEGKLVQQQILPEIALSGELSLETLPPGSYFIWLENALGESGIATIVKQ